MKVLGVDLGSYSIKVAELDVTGRGYALNNYFEFPLSVDPNRDRALEIIETLRSLSLKYDANHTRWVIAVPQHRVSVHQRRFPFRERQKILKSLPFELEDDIPLDIDETIFEAKVIEYLGPSAEVLTVAAPKEAVEEVLNISRDCGFDPEIVSVEGLALSNLFENWADAAPEISPGVRAAGATEEVTAVNVPVSQSRLILHLGHSRSLLLVYRDGGLVACRSIQWGGYEISEGLARVFGIPLVEAVRLLNSKSFILMNSEGANRDQIRLSETISGSVDNLLRELRLTLLEVRASYGLQFQNIELLGGVSQIQNLGAYITQGLEIPANVASSPFAGIQGRFALTPQMEATAPVAIGLAIEGMKRPRNPAINLRKDDFARENVTLKRFWETWRVPAQVAATAFAMFFVFSFIRDSITAGMVTTAEERLVEVAKNTAGLKGSAATESGVRKHITTKKTSIKNREALSEIEGYTSAMDILAKLAEKLPVSKRPAPGQGLDVTFLSLNNDDLTIEGRAQNAGQIPLIEEALNQIARPKSVQKTSGGAAGGAGVPFAYKMKVNRKL